VALRVLSGPLSNFADLAANDATTDLIVNALIAVGQFQRDLQTELTEEGIAAAEAEGRYRGRPPAPSGTPAEEARTAYLSQGASIAALARAHGVSRAAVRTALAGLLVAPLARAREEPDHYRGAGAMDPGSYTGVRLVATGDGRGSGRTCSGTFRALRGAWPYVV
jgi:hypothetical protein